MTAIIITLILLCLTVLWVRGWLRYSRLAVGIVIGAALAVALAPTVKAVVLAPGIPVWLPALPFALVATSLFACGLLLWFSAGE